MTATHWILLVLGAVVIALGMLIDTPTAPRSEPVPAELASEPELYMEGARISQFNPDGSLQYRLNADRLFHFPDHRRSVLQEPELHFIREDSDPPWDVEARHGRVLYEDTDTGEREIVELEEDVVLRRERPEEERFLQVETDALTVFPDSEFAETDRAVMITTEVGTTHGIGLEAHLQQGRMLLGTIAGNRVKTRISEPELLEP